MNLEWWVSYNNVKHRRLDSYAEAADIFEPRNQKRLERTDVRHRYRALFLSKLSC